MAEKAKWTNLEIALTIILFILGIIPGVIYLCVLLARKGYFKKLKDEIKSEEHNSGSK